MPAVNIKENLKEFKIELSAPGLKKDDIKASLDDHTITVSAEKEDSKTDEQEHYTKQEYNCSSGKM